MLQIQRFGDWDFMIYGLFTSPGRPVVRILYAPIVGGGGAEYRVVDGQMEKVFEFGMMLPTQEQLDMARAMLMGYTLAQTTFDR